MNLLRSLAFTLLFHTGSTLIVIVTALLLPLGPAVTRRGALVWADFADWCTRAVLGISVRVEGTLPAGPALIAVKHEAMYETLQMLRLLRNPAVVFKAELLRIPLWGRIALAQGVIPVDRKGGAGALRTMLTAARAAVTAGRPIVIFPEGTRTPHGQRPPLQPGFAGLYKALGLPVVPVAMDSGRLWPRRTFVKRPGIVTFRVGATIPPGLPREDVEARVHAAINALN